MSTDPAAPPPALLSRRRLLAFAILGLLALGAATAFVYALRERGRHHAEAVVVFHVSAQPPLLLSPTSPDALGFEGYKQSQCSLIKRRLTLTAALNQQGVSDLDIV